MEKKMVGRLAVLTAGLLSAQPGLVVHEWGTFTSVANSDGVPQVWQPLSGTPDLPCFVHQFEGFRAKGLLRGTVRMETPVIYFYSPRPLVASVHVDFPGGTFSEWYPHAKVEPSFYNPAVLEWNPIAITREQHAGPIEAAPNHYYAARNTDALDIESGGEHEKMLFYRGVGGFDLPLRAVLNADGQLQISNRGSNSLSLVVVFQNRGGKIGYRTLMGLATENIVGIEQMSGSLGELRQDLEAGLMQSGLYPREARAMLDTWRDSWFEEGTRVFYILPQQAVDEALPISIMPRPVQTVRTFVGRMELLTPWMREEISGALKSGDVAVLAKYGRFLRSFLQQIGSTPHAAQADAWLKTQSGQALSRPCP